MLLMVFYPNKYKIASIYIIFVEFTMITLQIVYTMTKQNTLVFIVIGNIELYID